MLSKKSRAPQKQSRQKNKDVPIKKVLPKKKKESCRKQKVVAKKTVVPKKPSRARKKGVPNKRRAEKKKSCQRKLTS